MIDKLNENQDETKKLKFEYEILRERYLRLVDLHGHVQSQCSDLEGRILQLVENHELERKSTEKSLCKAEEQIYYLEETIRQLQIDKQRYKDDCQLAVQLLHRSPDDFRINQLTNSTRNTATTLSIPTFPPTFVPPTTLFVPNSPNKNENAQSTNLFRSKSFDRLTSIPFVCSTCNRTARRSNVAVQTFD